jgi:quercetin dioxygenase-like cupin family protein
MTTTKRTASDRTFIPISDGVELCLLRRHAEQGATFFIRMRAGARAQLHEHPGGEETYVIEGNLRIENRRSAAGVAEPDIVVGPGDYVFVPPGETHDGIAVDGDVLIYVIAPGGIERK